MESIYKVLCEIKFEHEYFMTFEDGKNLFEESDPSKRADRLTQAYNDDRESFSRDIRFDFPEKLKSVYQSYGLKLLPSYSGCMVLVRVNEKRQPDNSTVFEPYFSLAEDLEIFILLIKKNNLPELYSNSRLSRSIPSIYLFSNDNINGTKVFPFIVSPLSSFDAVESYDQGELALDSGNNLVEIFYDNNGDLQKRIITSQVKAFASENDRILLPGKFTYIVTGRKPVTELEISVKDNSFNIIKQYSFNQSEPIRRVVLDFNDKADFLQLSETLTLPGGKFSFEVTGNNGYSERRNIVFGDHLVPAMAYGAVHLKTKPANYLFNLLTDEGWLQQIRDPLGVLSPAPVFEIPFKSRLGYFRYINSNGKELLLVPSLYSFLFKEDNALISQIPVPLCRYYFMITDNAGTTKKYLPNPKSYDIRTDEYRRIYFDILVSESDLFPIP